MLQKLCSSRHTSDRAPRVPARMLAKRDLFALLVSAFAVYYGSRSEGAATFDPAFHVPLDEPHHRVGAFALGDAPASLGASLGDHPGHRDPPPLFVDLDGDGSVETVVASARAAEIRVLAPTGGGSRRRRRGGGLTTSASSPKSGSSPARASAFAPARVLLAASTAPESVRVTAGREPVALGAGYLLRRKTGGDETRSRNNATRGSGGGRAASSSRTAVSRTAVIVAVTASRHVLCFDHNMRVMWETHLSDDVHVGGDSSSTSSSAPPGGGTSHRPSAMYATRHSARLAEVSVLVTAEPTFEGDLGSVIVGFRVRRGGDSEAAREASEAAESDALEDELLDELQFFGHRGGRRGRRSEEGGEEAARRRTAAGDRDLAAEAESDSDHFDYYAFEGGTGAFRWKHESGDFTRSAAGHEHHRDGGSGGDLSSSSDEETLTAQHDYRLDAERVRNARHFGEAACRDFRESFARDALPHSWRTREDTEMVLASVHRHKRPKREEYRREDRARDGDSSVARSDDSSVSAASSVPNAVVSRRERGVEIFHLHSGRPICSSHLPAQQLHADIDGDGVIDHAFARGGGGSSGAHASLAFDREEETFGASASALFGSAPPCWGFVSSGVPPRHAAFDGSVCRGALGATRHGKRHHGGEPSGGYMSSNNVEVLVPVAIRRGEERVARSRRRAVKDVVFLNSRGDLTCYAFNGVKRWQIKSDATWLKGSGAVPSLEAFEMGTRTPRRNAFKSAKSNSGSKSGSKSGSSSSSTRDVALAVGSSSFAIATPSGYVLFRSHLPREAGTVTAPAIVADADGDGLLDVCIRTESGTWVWTQRRREGFGAFSFLAGACAVGVGAALVARLANGNPAGAGRGTEWDGEESGRKDR